MATHSAALATSWPALLLAPSLALGDISLAYSLVSPACARQDSVILHAVLSASLVMALAMTAMAWRHWRAAVSTAIASAGAFHATTWSDGTDAAARPGFVALMATLVGALSSLVIVAVWTPVWWLPPCS
jgi:hypothetical protein